MSIKVMTDVWANSKARGGTLLVLLGIADYSDDNGRAFPAMRTLAKKSRLSLRQTQRTIQALIEFGELKVNIGDGRYGTNLFQVTLGGRQYDRGNDVNNMGGVTPVSQGGDAHGAEGVTPMSSNPSLRTINESPINNIYKFNGNNNCPYEEILEAFHKLCPTLPKVRKLNDSRKRCIRSMWKEFCQESDDPMELVRELFCLSEASDFLCRRSRGFTWIAGLDWIIDPKNKLKIMENTYANGARPGEIDYSQVS